ncbi:Ig-like domain-containing protein [Deinococcus sp. SM5_A1]|uniref:Ig-like domain-containing protein n=1 Tax=Deinococcus sp. SM5_A1 TaxID=3379094 RepID=UPI00385C0A6D
MKRALLLSLSLLAACGSVSQPPTPVSQAPAQTGTMPLVSLKLSAAGPIEAQGLMGAFPAAHFDVRVRDSAGRPVAFRGTTYDPTGAGSATLTLNTVNGFQQTLLLPAGNYTFENAALDDASSAVLLAYGPAAENPATVGADGGSVRLRFHAVFDRASSVLAPTLSTNTLFTDVTFNLALNPRTAAVAGGSAGVPTADLGNVTYTLGSATDGVLNGTGSKVGVNVTARGTAGDSVLNVTASFNAWMRDGSKETATYKATTLEYAQSIVLSGLVTDVVVPVARLATVSGAVVGSVTTLNGTATDDMQVAAIRVYDNGTLVASSVSAEAINGVTAVTSNAAGAWSAGWTPGTAGGHELTLVVSDSSGNEARAGQAVSVAAAPVQTAADFTLNQQYRSVEFDLQSGVPRTFKIVVPANAMDAELYFFNPGDCVSDGEYCSPAAPMQFTAALVNAQGQPVALEEDVYAFYNLGLPAGEYRATVTPTADTRVSLYGFTGSGG